MQTGFAHLAYESFLLTIKHILFLQRKRTLLLLIAFFSLPGAMVEPVTRQPNYL